MQPHSEVLGEAGLGLHHVDMGEWNSAHKSAPPPSRLDTRLFTESSKSCHGPHGIPHAALCTCAKTDDFKLPQQEANDAWIIFKGHHGQITIVLDTSGHVSCFICAPTPTPTHVTFSQITLRSHFGQKKKSRD